MHARIAYKHTKSCSDVCRPELSICGGHSLAALANTPLAGVASDFLDLDDGFEEEGNLINMYTLIEVKH